MLGKGSEEKILKKRESRTKRKLFLWIGSTLVAVGLSVIILRERIPPQVCACLPPEYVAHFTEADALEIVREQLEAAGLNFDGEVPFYYADHWSGRTEIALFDAERNVAIILVNPHEDANSSISDNGWLYGRLNHVETTFSELNDHISFGAFYNPSVIRPWRNQNRRRPHTEKEIQQLTERLEAPIQEFIEEIRETGIID